MHAMVKQEKEERAHACHMPMMSQRTLEQRKGNLQKRIAGNPVRGATGRNTCKEVFDDRGC